MLYFPKMLPILELNMVFVNVYMETEFEFKIYIDEHRTRISVKARYFFLIRFKDQGYSGR
jgi:hypothetical protein